MDGLRDSSPVRIMRVLLRCGVLVVLACNGVAGQVPVEPPLDPEIVEVWPELATAGDIVHIVVSGLDLSELDTEAITVSFGGAAATEIQLGTGEILARMPLVLPGFQRAITIGGPTWTLTHEGVTPVPGLPLRLLLLGGLFVSLLWVPPGSDRDDPVPVIYPRVTYTSVSSDPESAADEGPIDEPSPDEASKRPGIASVRLRGIGPFEDMTIELDPTRTIILGDNGVGKSSLLKAIGVGLMGVESSRYAERLIRKRYDTETTESKAEVELRTTDGRSFKTAIKSTASGVDVTTELDGNNVSQAVRELDWLCIGFPALRALTWGSATSDDFGRRRRHDDIEALIADAGDPRLDGLKAWLKEADFRELKDGPNNPRTRAKKDFVELIETITRNVEVELEEFDTTLERYMVRTQDGRVPLESLSQGTSALLGWLGYLTRRLHEFHAEAPVPIDGPAMVLVDEIAAHLHPEWQRTALPDITRHFPAAQFIATTHSPLVVAGLDSSQVVRLVRNDDGMVVQVEVEPHMTMGWPGRILGEKGLFGLETTLPVETAELVTKYEEMLGSADLDEEDRKKLDELEEKLAVRLGQPIDVRQTTESAPMAAEDEGS